MNRPTHEILKIRYKCSKCDLRDKNFFCSVPSGVLSTFESLKVTNEYSKGSTLFSQGQPSNGVYMLCQGRVKLTACSKDGRSTILGVAEAGEVLGLGAAISDVVHQATGEAIEDCQVNFVAKRDFQRFLKNNPEAAFNAARQLSRDHAAAWDQIRSLALSHSAAERLARLLLGWSSKNGNGSARKPMKTSFTHEEMAAMIGASRETVTRILRDFRERDLIAIHGKEFGMLDEKKLESMTGDKKES